MASSIPLTATDLGIFRVLFAHAHRRGRLTDADYAHTVLVIDAAGQRLAEMASLDRLRSSVVRGLQIAGAR